MADLSQNFIGSSPWRDRLDSLENHLYPKSAESVFKEYENDKWSSVLRSILKENVYDLDRLLCTLLGTQDPIKVCECGGEVACQTPPDFAQRYVESLHRQIVAADHANCKRLKVVEIGSGYGATLIPLAKLNYDKEVSFLGLELSESGVEAARRIAAHYDISENIDFRNQDFNGAFTVDCDSDEFLIILSSCSLLLAKDLSTVVFNILANNPRLVIHSEPTVHSISLDKTSLSSYRARYLLANDYNGHLYDCIRLFESAALCRVLEYLPYHFGGLNPLLPMSLIKWEPTRRPL